VDKKALLIRAAKPISSSIGPVTVGALVDFLANVFFLLIRFLV
jgi:hypothetical protein